MHIVVGPISVSKFKQFNKYCPIDKYHRIDKYRFTNKYCESRSAESLKHTSIYCCCTHKSLNCSSFISSSPRHAPSRLHYNTWSEVLNSIAPQHVMMSSKMASGTESKVEDVESLECVADGSTGVSISKEKAGTDTESKPKESAVWIYFEKMDQVSTGYRVARLWEGC